MRKTKRILAAAIAMLMCLSLLTACGDKTTYTRGSWNGNTYTNNALGFVYQMPEGWTAATEEQLMQTMDSGYESMTEQQKKDYDYSKQKTVLDFMTMADDQSMTVQLSVENLSLTAGSENLSEKEYADILFSQLSQNTQMTYEAQQEYTMQFYGKEFYVLPTEISNYATEDGDVLSQYYLIRREGKLMTVFIGTFLKSNTENFKNLLDQNFKAVNK